MNRHGLLPFLCTIVLFPAMLLTGCATTGRQGDSEQLLIQTWKARAEQAESTGDPRQALLAWKAVAALAPKDAKALQKVKGLEESTKQLAQSFFQKGLDLAGKNEAEEAQRSFLAALYLDPEHPQALAYLRAQLGGKDQVLHTLEQGESLSLVADRYYGDVHRYDIIAYFNDLNPHDPVQVGQVIKIPSLKGLEVSPKPLAAKEPAKMLEKAPDYPEDEPEEMVLVDLDSREMQEIVFELSLVRRMLNEARDALHAARYQQAADQAARILEIDPSNSEAAFILSDAHYQEGKKLAQEGQYERAMTRLEMVSRDYKDTGELLYTCRSTLADSHYRNGVKCFAEEKLEMAVAEFEETIRLDPEHPKARRDLEEVRKLIENLKRF